VSQAITTYYVINVYTDTSQPPYIRIYEGERSSEEGTGPKPERGRNDGAGGIPPRLTNTHTLNGVLAMANVQFRGTTNESSLFSPSK
jgi:hypothetical protein